MHIGPLDLMSHPASYLMHNHPQPISKHPQEGKGGTSLNRVGKAFAHTILPPALLKGSPCSSLSSQGQHQMRAGEGISPHFISGEARAPSRTVHLLDSRTHTRALWVFIASQILQSLRQLAVTPVPPFLPLFPYAFYSASHPDPLPSLPALY